MNKFLKSISFVGLLASLVLMSACFNDSDTVQPTSKTPDVGTDVGEQGSPSSNFSFRASPKITEIQLSWDSVAGATSYTVSRKLEGGVAIIENTANAQFSFSTGEEETYEVWVVALGESEEVLETSPKMNVTTGSSTSLLLSDEGI